MNDCWQNVNEALPDADIEVLVFVPGLGFLIANYAGNGPLEEESGWWVEHPLPEAEDPGFRPGMDRVWLPVRGVTHWQDLPEEPITEEVSSHE